MRKEHKYRLTDILSVELFERAKEGEEGFGDPDIDLTSAIITFRNASKVKFWQFGLTQREYCERAVRIKNMELKSQDK